MLLQSSSGDEGRAAKKSRSSQAAKPAKPAAAKAAATVKPILNMVRQASAQRGGSYSKSQPPSRSVDASRGGRGGSKKGGRGGKSLIISKPRGSSSKSQFAFGGKKKSAIVVKKKAVSGDDIFVRSLSLDCSQSDPTNIHCGYDSDGLHLHVMMIPALYIHAGD